MFRVFSRSCFLLLLGLVLSASSAQAQENVPQVSIAPETGAVVLNSPEPDVEAPAAPPIVPSVKLATDAITAAVDDPNKIVFNADRVTRDDEQHLVIARGNVQMAQNDQVLTADVVSYNQETDRIIATGNVIMRESGGSIFFGDYLELNNQMKEGFLNQVRVLLAADARVTATAASRREGRYMDMDHATYSPCVLCKDDPTRPPVWQMKATQVTH